MTGNYDPNLPPDAQNSTYWDEPIETQIRKRFPDDEEDLVTGDEDEDIDFHFPDTEC